MFHLVQQALAFYTIPEAIPRCKNETEEAGCDPNEECQPEPPVSTVLPEGTGLPGGTEPPEGTGLPGGTAPPGGTGLPEETGLPGG